MRQLNFSFMSFPDVRGIFVGNKKNTDKRQIEFSSFLTILSDFQGSNLSILNWFLRSYCGIFFCHFLVILSNQLLILLVQCVFFGYWSWLLNNFEMSKKIKIAHIKLRWIYKVAPESSLNPLSYGIFRLC